MRGEHKFPSMPVLGLYLDHPRMRGEHLSQSLREVGDRGIIPACAGST